MEGLGINLGYLIVQIGAIIVLIVLMRGFAYKPITRMLEERQARIAKGLEDARQAAIARENADLEAKKVIDEARTEAAQIRSDAVIQAEETASGILSKANADAKVILANANEEALEENAFVSSRRFAERPYSDLLYRLQLGEGGAAVADRD